MRSKQQPCTTQTNQRVTVKGSQPADRCHAELSFSVYAWPDLDTTPSRCFCSLSCSAACSACHSLSSLPGELAPPRPGGRRRNMSNCFRLDALLCTLRQRTEKEQERNTRMIPGGSGGGYSGPRKTSYHFYRHEYSGVRRVAGKHACTRPHHQRKRKRFRVLPVSRRLPLFPVLDRQRRHGLPRGDDRLLGPTTLLQEVLHLRPPVARNVPRNPVRSVRRRSVGEGVESTAGLGGVGYSTLQGGKLDRQAV